MGTRVVAVVEREWAELRLSLTLILTILLPPALFVAIPLALLQIGATVGPLGLSETSLPVQADRLRELHPAFRGLSDREVLQAFSVLQFLALFLLVPILVPLAIATHSIIGEKQARTLEPLLATPIRTWELLLAKALAAALPGIVVGWLAYVILLILARPLISEAVWSFMVAPTWLVAVFLVGPLVALLAVEVGIVVSARVNDVRAAQQIGAILILPIFATLLAQIAGLVHLSAGLMLVVALITLIADAMLLAVAVRLFQREMILTRWR